MNNQLIVKRILVSVIGAVLILVGGRYAQKSLAGRETPVRQMSFTEQTKTVKAEPVEYRSREIAISNIGRVLSENAIDLITEVQGTIERGDVLLKRGQRFRKGQVLFKVNDEEARLGLYAQKSNFMTTLAGILPDLKLDFPDTYEAWQTYFDQLSVEEALPTLPEIKNSQEKIFFSTKNVINEYYNIKSAEERLSKYVVKAPFSGSIFDVLQEVNSVVNNGTRVARIAQAGLLELEVPIRVEDLSYLRTGLTVDVYAENRESKWRGRVKRIGSIVDPTTQSVNVYIGFSSGGKQIYEGQYLTVQIPGTRVRDVMEIPRNAVFNQNQVYVVNDSSLLNVKSIQIEKLNDETLYFSGLPKGEKVVTEPLVNVYENMPVVLDDEAESEGPSSQAAGFTETN
ncbi:MAG: efflux RND transporter periplasmic adaptor subunit [Bacteroidota bacterium]